MSSSEELSKKKFFFQLLSGYLDNSFNDKDKKLLKLFYLIKGCKECGNAGGKNLYFPKLNSSTNLLLLLDPFYLYEDYKPEDESKIKELFSKILKGIRLSPEDVYLTYSIKCILKNDFFKNKKKYKEIFLKELEAVEPKYILIFGRYAHELFFSELKDVKFNNVLDSYQLYGSRLFFTSSPAEIFYDTSLKSAVWEFLKFFRKTIQE